MMFFVNIAANLAAYVCNIFILSVALGLCIKLWRFLHDSI